MRETSRGIKNWWMKFTGKNSEDKYYYDYNLLVVVILLITFGLIMLYSISSYTAMIEGDGDMYYFIKQLLFSLSGLFIMFIVSKIPYQQIEKFSFWVYWLSIILMLLVLTPLGVEANGARRWIKIAGIQFQPSEFAKVALILFLSSKVCKIKGTIDRSGSWLTSNIWLKINPNKNRKWHKQVLNEWRDNWFTLLLYGALSSIIISECTDNLSTAIVVAGITLGILAISSKKGVAVVAFAIAIIAFIVRMIFTVGEDFILTFMDGYRAERILVWINPENYSQDGGYQVLQGLYAIGTGGWFGKGLGNGTQKLTAIPEVQNDYIIAAIIEELGIFGALIIMVLFILLLYRLFFIASNAPDMYSGLVVSGIFIHIALQVILNIGVVTAIIPNTGITLPFISYGGTATWFLLAEIGMALQISSWIKINE